MENYCGAKVPYFGDTTGATSSLESYGCTDRTLSGGEVTYRLDSPITGHIVAHLVAHDADLDLIVVGADADGDCSPTERCLASARSIGAAEARVEVSAAKDETLYVIVDGASGAASGYTLTLDCTPGVK